MRKLVWLSDLHLNFVSKTQFEVFLESVSVCEPTAVAISGDISEAPDFGNYLIQMAQQWQVPVLFVLGNHDFYRGTIRDTRLAATALWHRSPLLRYLTSFEVIQLSEITALIGHDGWGDGRAGNGRYSMVELADFQMIADLKDLSAAARFAKLNLLGDEAALHFRKVLPTALEHFKHVLVLTHVPPLAECCWHEGRIADSDWQPHFVCQAVGEEILRWAERYPDRWVTVLCGHTHCWGELQLPPNLTFISAAAEYGRPAIQRVFEIH